MDRRTTHRLIRWLYAGLLWLYPVPFRDKFAAEQREVFEQALDAEPGSIRLFAREMIQLPGLLLRLHWAALRAGGWKSLLGVFAMLFIFVTPAFEAISRFVYGNAPWLNFLILAGLVIGLVAAIIAGFPRWGIPYLGFVLGIIGFYGSYLLLSPVMMLLPRRDYSALPIVPRLLYGAFWDAARTALLLGIVYLVLRPLRALSAGRQMRLPRPWQHTRRWSDISFLMYGAAIFSVLIGMDEYQHNETVMLLATACLMLGAIVFLRISSQRNAVAALLVAVTLAFGIIAVGKYYVVPLQTQWEGWFEGHPVEIERWFESLSSVTAMIFTWVALLVPATWRAWLDRTPQTG